MTKARPKRKIKDSVFTNLFRDRKYLFQMYKTLHPEDCDATEDSISDVTLRPILIDAEYNDVGFMVGSRLVALVESQSTWSVNIVVRALMYLVQTYHDYLMQTGQYLYGSSRVSMPKPELYVVYTGNRKNIPDTISLRAEFFGGEQVAIDAEVKVLWRPEEDNIIGQYIIFCKVFDAQRRKHGRTREAVAETIRICRERNVLKEYLEDKGQEVVDIMMALFDEDYIWESYWNYAEKELEKKVTRKVTREVKRKVKKEVEQKVEKEVEQRVEKEVEQRVEKEVEQRVEKEVEQRVEKAVEEVREKTVRETASRMLREGEPPEKVARYVSGLSEEEIRILSAEIIQPA